MTSTNSFDIRKFLYVYKRVLLWGAIGLAEFYLLWSLLQFVVWDKPYLKLEKWWGLALIAGTLAYLIIAAVKSPAAIRRIRKFGKRAASPEQIFVIVFFVWYIVVCALRTLLNGKSYFDSNDNRLFYTAISALLFFPLVELVGRKRGRRIIEIMMNSALFAYTPVCAWVLWKFNHGELVSFPSGNAVTLHNGLALQIGAHRNMTASYSIILLGVCIYMLLTMQSKLRFAVYIPCALVHLTVIILTNSRTSFIVLIAMVSCAVFMRGIKYVKVRNKALVIIAAAVILAAGIALFFFLRNGILSFNADIWKEKLQNDSALKARKMQGFNGRINIWKASFKLMVSSPGRFFLGVTPTELPDILWGIGKFPVRQPNCHNVFLQVGTCFGVPMMIAYIWFVFSIIRRAVRVMTYSGERLFRNAWAVPMIMLGILLTEMMEVLTLANHFLNQPVFYILAGGVVAMDKRISRRKRRQNTEKTIR